MTTKLTLILILAAFTLAVATRAGLHCRHFVKAVEIFVLICRSRPA